MLNITVAEYLLYFLAFGLAAVFLAVDFALGAALSVAFLAQGLRLGFSGSTTTGSLTIFSTCMVRAGR